VFVATACELTRGHKSGRQHLPTAQRGCVQVGIHGCSVLPMNSVTHAGAAMIAWSRTAVQVREHCLLPRATLLVQCWAGPVTQPLPIQ
jgi:hypothetical protein